MTARRTGPRAPSPAAWRRFAALLRERAALIDAAAETADPRQKQRRSAALATIARQAQALYRRSVTR